MEETTRKNCIIHHAIKQHLYLLQNFLHYLASFVLKGDNAITEGKSYQSLNCSVGLSLLLVARSCQQGLKRASCSSVLMHTCTHAWCKNYGTLFNMRDRKSRRKKTLQTHYLVNVLWKILVAYHNIIMAWDRSCDANLWRGYFKLLAIKILSFQNHTQQDLECLFNLFVLIFQSARSWILTSCYHDLNLWRITYLTGFSKLLIILQMTQKWFDI